MILFNVAQDIKKCVLSRISPRQIFEFHLVNTIRVLIAMEPHMAIIQAQIQENLIEIVLVDRWGSKVNIITKQLRKMLGFPNLKPTCHTTLKW
jgi:hypothetical protein